MTNGTTSAVMAPTSLIACEGVTVAYGAGSSFKTKSVEGAGTVISKGSTNCRSSTRSFLLLFFAETTFAMSMPS